MAWMEMLLRLDRMSDELTEGTGVLARSYVVLSVDIHGK